MDHRNMRVFGSTTTGPGQNEVVSSLYLFFCWDYLRSSGTSLPLNSSDGSLLGGCESCGYFIVSLIALFGKLNQDHQYDQHCTLPSPSWSLPWPPRWWLPNMAKIMTTIWWPWPWHWNRTFPSFPLVHSLRSLRQFWPTLWSLWGKVDPISFSSNWGPQYELWSQCQWQVLLLMDGMRPGPCCNYCCRSMSFTTIIFLLVVLIVVIILFINILTIAVTVVILWQWLPKVSFIHFGSLPGFSIAPSWKSQGGNLIVQGGDQKIFYLLLFFT